MQACYKSIVFGPQTECSAMLSMARKTGEMCWNIVQPMACMFEFQRYSAVLWCLVCCCQKINHQKLPSRKHRYVFGSLTDPPPPPPFKLQFEGALRTYILSPEIPVHIPPRVLRTQKYQINTVWTPSVHKTQVFALRVHGRVPTKSIWVFLLLFKQSKKVGGPSEVINYYFRTIPCV